MRVSTAEFIGGFDGFADRAETEPVTITEGGHDRLVLVSAGEYARLVERDVTVPATGDPTEHDGAELVEPSGEMPELWGALRDTIIYVSDDIAEPTGEVWDAER